MDIVDRQSPAPEEAASFHASLARFYVEHLHADEEARYILGGGGVWRSTAVAVMKGLGSTER
jgi:cupin superfamily acireductone dioxygenase involved in methionine salvage